ncbi:MAG: heavy metal translocating P-type ATPase metal-binding domain-containing protein [Bacteroidia bacterium]|jgi:P-type Cu+ transporter|nr:heavy metal translocating P-type ATPase metal-binding domain-containing protein [Bacteroidia bacterium]
MSRPVNTATVTSCYHCGETCNEDAVKFDEKDFCCPGCKLVYEVLAENNLCNYYSLENQPGNTQKTNFFGERFAYLDDQNIQQKLIRFQDKESIHIRFHIPGMHCSSCIWLLEHLNRLDKGIIRSQSDFIRKELTIVYDPTQTGLRSIVEKLHQIGYPPELNLQQIEKKDKKKQSRSRIYKIGVAGFAFGNIMLLSFPEYFSGGVYHGDDFKEAFGYLNLLLAIPVFLFSASEFLENSLLSFRQRVINIDVPIAIGIVAMFIRSTYEILSGTGPGYFDSMTGLVFFMLIGRNFQSKTYEWLSFDRDYKSYFPIAVTRFSGTREEAIAVQDIKVSDRLLIRNQEIIPADVMLLSDQAEIDYSFVTGESNPVTCEKGDRLFAGGRLIGSPASVLVQQEVSHSYLTQLWNQSSGKAVYKSGFQLLVERISRWFVVVTLLIAATSFAWWYMQHDTTRAINAFTAVLVIACACALALSAPFTFGNMLRILGKNGIYLKNTGVLEKLADIDTVLFDKTGTLTEADKATIEYKGESLSEAQQRAISSLANSSSHPLSRMLSKHLEDTRQHQYLSDVREIPGNGIEGKSGNYFVRLGNSSFTGDPQPDTNDFRTSRVGVNINGEHMGYFLFHNHYRPEAATLTKELKSNDYQIAVISGDHEHERPHLEAMLGQKEGLRFEQQPGDKLNYVDKLQKEGKKVMMVGDGLNDAGALLCSHVGLAIAEDINNFTPGCDGIILSKRFGSIHRLLQFAKAGHRIIIISFIISLVYNAVGLWFAVQGTLSPVIAAILMPISTSSLVVYTVISSSLKARQLHLRAGN